MKYDLHEQFTPVERAVLLLNKYSIKYLKEIVNGIIVKSKKDNDIYILNYWNEVSIEIKKIIDKKEIR